MLLGRCLSRVSRIRSAEASMTARNRWSWWSVVLSLGLLTGARSTLIANQPCRNPCSSRPGTRLRACDRDLGGEATPDNFG